MNWETVDAKRDKRSKAGWHLWFAWYPVRIGERRYWLERVVRLQQWSLGYYTPSYRTRYEWRGRS